MGRPARPTDETDLPEGVLWRRAVEQLVVRLGVFPGDRVVLAAPAGHDPAAACVDRLPRIDWARLGPDEGPFALPGSEARIPEVRWVEGALEAPPIEPGAVEAFVWMFGGTLLPPEAHEAVVEAWADTLPGYGKWMELVSVAGPRDPRLLAGEAHLRAAGFEKVRSTRLALGRVGGALFLQTGRATGAWESDDEEE